MTRLLRLPTRRLWHHSTKAAASVAAAATNMSVPPSASDASANPPTNPPVEAPAKLSVDAPAKLSADAPVSDQADTHTNVNNNNTTTQVMSSTTIAASISSTTAVSKIPGRSTLPEDATSNPHHLVKRGEVVGFKNPYPSWSHSVGFSTILRRVVWYEPSPSSLPQS